LDHNFGLESTGICLGQELPCILGVVIHDLAESTPEVTSSITLLTTLRHIHLRTLEVLRNNVLLLGKDLLLELLTCSLLLDLCQLTFGWSRIRTVRTKEVVDVISQDVGIRQHQVHSSTLFTSSLEKQTLCLGALNLFDQCIFNCTGVLVQKDRGFSTEVLKNLKTLIAYLT